MKKNTVTLTSLITLSIVLQYFLPWWSLAIPCFIIGYMLPYTPSRSFWLNFLIMFLIWISVSLLLDLSSNGKMSNEMASVFFMPHKYLLFLVGGIIGGVTAGFSSLAGTYFKNYRKSKQRPDHEKT